MKIPYRFRKCTKCGKWLVAYHGNFNKNKTGKWGLRNICKNCQRDYNKKDYEKNKDHYKEYRKNHYKNNKSQYKENQKRYIEKNKEHLKDYYANYYIENIEHCKEYRKEYYKNNKEKIICSAKKSYEDNKEYRKKYVNEWRKNNKDLTKKYSKKWRDNNKESIKEHRKIYLESEAGQVVQFNSSTKRRALLNQGKGITKEQWKEMMDFFDWKCGYSEDKLDRQSRTIDHIVPLNKKGKHVIWNLIPAKRGYNSSKQDRIDVMNWYKEQEYFSEERLKRIVEWQLYAYEKWADKEIEELILIIDL